MEVGQQAKLRTEPAVVRIGDHRRPLRGKPPPSVVYCALPSPRSRIVTIIGVGEPNALELRIARENDVTAPGGPAVLGPSEYA